MSKDFSPRFAAPLDVARPRGARLLEAFSPKLRRRIRLFDRASFDQWVRLEADPQVLSLCERPARLGPTPDSHLIDFWVQHRDGEHLLLIDDDEPAPTTIEGLAVRRVCAADLAASAIWTANWHRMLPVITMCRALAPKALAHSVLALVREPMPLVRIEHELAIGDPSLVRATIFDLLRTGRLSAPSLHARALSLHTLVEPNL
jgi:hypothetical protein